MGHNGCDGSQASGLWAIGSGYRFTTFLIIMFTNAHPKEKGQCLLRIQEFCEGINCRRISHYAVCDLRPQTSRPGHFFVSA